ncbi:hypothetical protein P43SY_006004 [Pythium insidiosum]|uniref:Uncharacterized protein n=1 Tax=Pythium insidiosum TaxID=114742 RepID=A0AAD5M4D0_PYTIN|nr:hypothetical protein P43SY_006004 [Pythium insidiosum]KAJ0404620.1 hypothetical protein ATCC90586_001189 [Pythium insidiosum]
MSATQQEIEQLQSEIAKGAEATKSYLAQLKDKLAEYDSHYKVSETATSYLQGGMDKAHASVDELKNVGARIKQSSKDTTESWVAAAQQSIAQVHTALEDLKQRAIDYDQRVKSSVSSSVSTATGSVSSSIEAIVTTTRQTATSGMEQLSQSLASLQAAVSERAAAAGHEAFVKTGDAVKKVEEVDSKYGVRDTIAGTVAAVTEKVMDLDKKLGVSETALKVDAKVSGGMGASLVNKGMELVHQSVEYVSNTLHQAKVASDESAAPAASDAAPQPEAPKTA